MASAFKNRLWYKAAADDDTASGGHGYATASFMFSYCVKEEECFSPALHKKHHLFFIISQSIGKVNAEI